jgi:hypothetical protein
MGGICEVISNFINEYFSEGPLFSEIIRGTEEMNRACWLTEK